MKTASCLTMIAALLVTSLASAFAATHHTLAYRSYGHAPVRITIHPARIDFSRYIDPVTGMYCRNTGWAAECVPPPLYARGVDCAAAWPFPICWHF